MNVNQYPKSIGRRLDTLSRMPRKKSLMKLGSSLITPSRREQLV
ncbi:hypothetical protein [Mesobacillus foraminis]|nr:hypothetical protein [Mesobacillus foraminis]